MPAVERGRRWRRLALPLLASLLAACAGKQAAVRGDAPARPLVDSAPPMPIDLSRIPEPVPKAEPRARYGNHSPYEVFGKRYQVLPDSRGYVARGIASWYGTKFHGRLTSNREPYDMYAYTAAHKSLPLPTYARVTNLENGRSAIVRINDRGPFVGTREIDLSYVAAVKLGVHLKGTAMVEVRALDPEAPLPDPHLAAAGTPPAPAASTAMPPALAPVAPPRPAVTTIPPPTTVAGAHAGTDAIAAAEPPLLAGLYLQCGAFSTPDNARMLRGRLLGAGFASTVIQPEQGAGPYRVLVGPFADRIEAIAAHAEATRRGFGGARIIER